MSVAPRKHLTDKSRIIKSIIDAESTRREKQNYEKGHYKNLWAEKNLI